MCSVQKSNKMIRGTLNQLIQLIQFVIVQMMQNWMFACVETLANSLKWAPFRGIKIEQANILPPSQNELISIWRRNVTFTRSIKNRQFLLGNLMELIISFVNFMKAKCTNCFKAVCLDATNLKDGKCRSLFVDIDNMGWR